MAISVSVSDLLQEIRDRGNFRDPQYTDTELLRYANASYRHWYRWVARMDPSSFLSTDSVSLVSGTQNYDLASDLYKLDSVYVADSSSPSGFLLLHRIQWRDRYRLRWPLSTQLKTYRYAVRNNDLYIYPKPGATGTINYDYIPSPPTLVASGPGAGEADSFDSFAGSEEWIVADVCVKCAAKRRESTKDWVEQRNAVWAEMAANLQHDESAPRVVQDVHGWRRPWHF